MYGCTDSADDREEEPGSKVETNCRPRGTIEIESKPWKDEGQNNETKCHRLPGSRNIDDFLCHVGCSQRGAKLGLGLCDLGVCEASRKPIGRCERVGKLLQVGMFKEGCGSSLVVEK